ncbi:hypothetical protein O3G_MSEX008751, partial [Manduca sexta]
VPVIETSSEKEYQTVKNDVVETDKFTSILTGLHDIKKKSEIETSVDISSEILEDDIPSPELIQDTYVETKPIISVEPNVIKKPETEKQFDVDTIRTERESSPLSEKEGLKQYMSEKDEEEISTTDTIKPTAMVEESIVTTKDVTPKTPAEELLTKSKELPTTISHAIDKITKHIVSDKLDEKQVSLEKDIHGIMEAKPVTEIDGEKKPVSDKEKPEKTICSPLESEKLLSPAKLEEKELIVDKLKSKEKAPSTVEPDKVSMLIKPEKKKVDEHEVQEKVSILDKPKPDDKLKKITKKEIETTFKDDEKDIDEHEIVLVRDSSSEEVSKEASLEEKYSFEQSEKIDKKPLADLTTQEDKLPLDDISSYTDSIQSFTSQKEPESIKPIDDKKKKHFPEVGSPRDEVAMSEASDSGVHSILMEGDHISSIVDEHIQTQSIKDSAAHLMESIHKAFGDENIQQGIKTESLEALAIRSEIDRVSTPPTVPVSPLPKTPSSFQDVKMADGIQSEVTYDKSDGSEETITKVVHVGEDVLTQKISTSTEKVPKVPKTTDIDGDSDLLTLMQTVGKIKTETDTVTKIIKEGENVVTQTITTVTTKEIISREDGTPQNIKTTIETTTLSKGPDGSITTTKDTQTLLSECSSSLRSTSQMDLYAKESKIDKDYLDSSDEKSETLSTFQIKDITEKIHDRDSYFVRKDLESFISESDDVDDNIEDTVIDTDVSKRIVKENNIDIIETITTITKKETIRISDTNKILRTTVETNITKEHPDGSKDVQKNVEVKTEELVLDSSSNLDKILSEYVIYGEPEESVTTKIEEVKQETFIIKRTIVTRIVKTKYADTHGIPRKLKTVTTVTTTDEYPDGSARTKVDSSTTLTDIETETVETQEIQEFTEVEDKTVETDKQEKSVLINGKSVLQIITTITTKEMLTNKDKTKRKLKTTVETVTETMLPEGMTEVTKDVKVSVCDCSLDDVKESLEGYEPIGQPKEYTVTEEESIVENGNLIKRRKTTTTIVEQFKNIIEKLKRTRTTVIIVTEDEHPDGSIITKTSERVSVVEEILDGFEYKSDLDKDRQEIVPQQDIPQAKPVKPTVDKDMPREEPPKEKAPVAIVEEISPEAMKIEKALEDLVPAEEPEITETTKIEEIMEEEIIIRRVIVMKIIRTKYADRQGVLRKLKTVTITTTTDNYPDSTARTHVETSTMLSDIEQDVEDVIEESLQGFEPVGKPKEDTVTKIETITEGGIIIKRHLTVITITQEFNNVITKTKRTKTTIKTITEDEYPDGSVVTRTSEKASLVDETLLAPIQDGVESSDDEDTYKLEVLKDLTPDGEPEITETTQTEDVKEKDIIIKRTIITRIVKTKYSDSQKVVRKVKTVTTITTTDQYPEGTAYTTVDTHVVVTDVEMNGTVTPSEPIENDIIMKDMPIKKLPSHIDKIYAPEKKSETDQMSVTKEVTEKVAPKEQVVPVSKEPLPEREVSEKESPKEQLAPISKEPSPEKEVSEKEPPKEQVAPISKEPSSEKEIPEKESPEEHVAPISKEPSPEKEVPEKASPKEQVAPVSKEPSPEREVPEKVEAKEQVAPILKEPSQEKEVPEKDSPKEQAAPISKEPSPEKEVPDKAPPKEKVAPVSKKPSPEREVPEKASSKEQIAPVSKESSPEKEVPDKAPPKEPVAPISKEPSPEKEVPDKAPPKEKVAPVSKEPSPGREVPEKVEAKEQAALISKEPSPEKEVPDKAPPKEQVTPVSRELSPEKEVPEKTSPKEQVATISKELSLEKTVPEKESPKEQAALISKEPSPEKEVPEKVSPKEQVAPVSKEPSPEREVPEKVDAKEQVAPILKEPSQEKEVPEKDSPKEQVAPISKEPSPEKEVPDKAPPKEKVAPVLKEPSPEREVPEKVEAKEQAALISKEPSPVKEVPEKESPKEPVTSVSKEPSPEKEVPEKASPKEKVGPVSKEPSPEREVPYKTPPKEQVTPVSKEPSPEKEVPEKASPKEQAALISKEPSPEKEVPEKDSPKEQVAPISKEPSPEKEVPDKAPPKEK